MAAAEQVSTNSSATSVSTSTVTVNQANAHGPGEAEHLVQNSGSSLTLEERTAQHPCFAAHCTGKNSRIHLAVAPKCNVQCNYCLRKMDCVNETRPGVTSKVLSPEQAVERYHDASDRLDNLTVAGIAGPGDALANWEETRKTFEGIRALDPDVTFCLSTNGLQLPRYVDELAEIGVSHLTVTLNAVDPAITAKLYRFVQWDGKYLTGLDAGRRLLTNQLTGIQRAVELGLCVKINTVLVAGINVDHAVEVARVASRLGVSYQNITCMIPVKGSAFQNLPVVDEATHARVRKECSKYLQQIYHCRQCRADAVGKLGQDLSALFDRLAAERAQAKAEQSAAASQPPETTSPKGTELPETELPGNNVSSEAASGAEPSGSSVSPAVAAVRGSHATLPGSNASSSIPTAQPVSIREVHVEEAPAPQSVEQHSAERSQISAQTQQPISSQDATSSSQADSKSTYRFAVASRSSTHVDEHFGHADSFYIYETDGDDVKLVEERDVAQFCQGPSECGRPDLEQRFQGAIAAISDCDAVLALKVGPAPRQALARLGVHVFETYDFIEDAALDAYDALTGRQDDGI